jgi:hypothetical protein
VWRTDRWSPAGRCGRVRRGASDVARALSRSGLETFRCGTVDHSFSPNFVTEVDQVVIRKVVDL